MTTTELTDACKQLKLAYINDMLAKTDETLKTFVYDVLIAEIEGRKRAKLGKLLKDSNIPQIKTFENYSFEDITFSTDFNKGRLFLAEWIDKKENLILMGGVETLKDRFKQDSMRRFSNQLKKCDLLILDEVGYLPFEQVGSELLFNVIADCYERQSIIVTTNLEFG